MQADFLKAASLILKNAALLTHRLSTLAVILASFHASGALAGQSPATPFLEVCHRLE
jgi:hypothetical protein